MIKWRCNWCDNVFESEDRHFSDETGIHISEHDHELIEVLHGN